MHFQLNRSLRIITRSRFISTNLNSFRKDGIVDLPPVSSVSRLVYEPPQKKINFSVTSSRPPRFHLPFYLPTCSGLPRNISSPVPVTLNILDPMLNRLICEKIEPSPTLTQIEEPPKLPVSKECVRKGSHMLIVRIRKMRKHKYRKLQKKLGRTVLKYKERRRKKRDVLFQAEMLAKVRAADEFHAETYVKDILRKVHEKPKEKTQEMLNEMYTELRRKNRSNVDVIPPKFDRSDV